MQKGADGEAAAQQAVLLPAPSVISILSLVFMYFRFRWFFYTENPLKKLHLGTFVVLRILPTVQPPAVKVREILFPDVSTSHVFQCLMGCNASSSTLSVWALSRDPSVLLSHMLCTA